MHINFKSFKNKIALFLAILLIMQFTLLTSNGVQASVNTGISYSITGDTTVGGTVTISVNVSNVTDLYGGSIDFVYDPTLLQVQSITKGNVFGSKTTLTPLGEKGQVNNGKASFAITLKGNTEGVNTTSGTIAVIKAKVLKAGTVKLNTTNSNSALSLSGNTLRVKLSNSMANSLTYIYENKSFTTTETTNTAKLTSFTTDKQSGATLGSTIKVTATSDSGSNTLYQFSVCLNGKWTTIQDFSSASSVNWTPSSVGNYQLRVRVKHKNSSNYSDDYRYLNFTVAESNTAKLTSFTTDKQSGATLGSTIKVTATSDSKANALYQFSVCLNGKWTTIQDFSSASSVNWTPSSVGDYQLRVRIKHKNSSNYSDDYRYLNFTVNP